MKVASLEPRSQELILIGGGEHARVVLDAAASLPGRWRVTAYADPLPQPDLDRLGLAWLGDDSTAATGLRGRSCIIAVGATAGAVRRQRIRLELEPSGLTWASVVHASATLSASATIGDGVAVLAGATVNPGARVDDHAIVNTGAIVEHDATIEAFVHLGPGAIVGGGTFIGRGTFVGLGARIRDHIRIGIDAVIGMGAVVVQDIPDRTTYVGVPARPIATAQRHGEPASYDGTHDE
jgi:acetyltransferase EpsM